MSPKKLFVLFFLEISRPEEYIHIKKCGPVGDAFPREKFDPQELKLHTNAHDDHDDRYSKVFLSQMLVMLTHERD